MPAEITMPQLSDTMTEGTVVKWKKKEGEKVRSGEEIAEIETDKATMPMEAFESGTLALISIKEGQKVKVGGVLGVIAKTGENAEDIRKKYAAGSQGAATLKPAEEPVAAAQGPHGATSKQGTATAPNEQSWAGASSGEMHESDSVKAHGATRGSARERAEAGKVVGEPVRHDGNGRPRISPLARRLAEENNVDLDGIQGSGPGGRIVQQDILAFIQGGGKAGAATEMGEKGSDRPAMPPVLLGGQTQVIAMTKMRTAIAAALQRSKQTIPHFYETVDIDVEELGKLRERLNTKLEKENVRLSISDFITKAVASALVKHAALNARFNSDKGEITRYGDVNLGMAVSIPDGLIVPVLRGVNQMGLRDIRVRSADLIDRARQQRLKREEQSEGTFTISSLGTLGIREFSAIINPPEVAILAVGAAEPRPAVRGGQIVARTMMSVTLSCDHRAVDGATAAEFLKTLKETLEEPGMMLV